MPSPSILNATTIDMLRELDGGSGFFAELVQEYTEQSDRLLAQINQAFNADDRKTLQFAVHTLKGSSYNIGADALGECCASFERLKYDERADQEEVLAEVTELYAKSIAALRDALSIA